MAARSPVGQPVLTGIPHDVEAADLFRIYVAGTSGERAELPGRFSDASDVDDLYARFCERFPQVREIAGRVACGEAGAGAVAEFIGRAYRIADPQLDAIPPQADSGFDSWCPREDGTGTKYWDRVPLNAMISAGYYPSEIHQFGAIDFNEHRHQGRAPVDTRGA
jgi:hypothetical protein